MSVVRCVVPLGTKATEFDPFPASEKAIARGCTCPEQRWWPAEIAFAADCPVHELEKAPH